MFANSKDSITAIQTANIKFAISFTKAGTIIALKLVIFDRLVSTIRYYGQWLNVQLQIVFSQVYNGKYLLNFSPKQTSYSYEISSEFSLTPKILKIRHS